MKILQIVQKPQRRGAEIFAYQLSAALRRMGHVVHTSYLYPYAGESPLDLLPGDRVLDGSEGHPFEIILGHHPGLLRRIDRVLDDLEPDVVQLNGARTVKYGALSKRRRNSVGWGLVYRNIDNPAYWARDSLRRWFYRNLVFPEIDGTVGVSQATLDEVERMYGLETPAVFIPNGFDPASLDDAPSPIDARRSLGIDEQTPLLLFMGNLTRQKRPDRFLRVVSGVMGRVPSAQAGVLGSGPLEGTLREQAQSLGITDAVSFWGYQTDVAPYIAASDVLMVTSDSDGIPAVVLEASFLRKPTVATNVGGLRECVVDGSTGILVDSTDEKVLIEHTVTLLNDVKRRSEMGDSARRFVLSGFSIDAIAERYMAFYEQIVTAD